MSDVDAAVVVVNWNGFERTMDCIRTVHDLEVRPALVVVVDNGSTDGSADRLAIAGWSDVHLIRLDENLGFAGGANAGYVYAISRGARYVWFLNNDALPQAGAYEALKKTLLKSDRIAASGSVVWNTIDHTVWFAGGKVNAFTGVSKHYYTVPSVDRVVTFLTGCSLLVRTEAAGEKPFSTDYFMYSEDVELSVRLNRSGYQLWVSCASEVHHAPSSSLGSSTLFYYYITRNLLAAARRISPIFWVLAIPVVIKRYLIPSLFHSAAKGAIQGVVDFLAGRMGPIGGG